MKRTTLCLATALLGLGAVPPAPARGQAEPPPTPVAERPTYRVGIDRQFPPYTFVDDTGVARGFAVELIQEVAASEDFDVELVALTWPEMRAALAEGKIDIVANMPSFDSTEEQFTLTLPHSQADDAIFTRLGSAGITEGTLRGRKVLVMEGDTAHNYLTAGGITDDIQLEPSVADVLRHLALGEAECALLPQNVGLRLTNRLSLENVAIGRPIKSYRRSFSFAVAKGSPLIDTIEEGLSIVTSDGRYNQIYDRWLGGVDLEEQQRRQLAQQLLLTLALVLGVAVVLAAAWLWSLRRTVARRTAELEREVIERRRAEEALLASERKYRGLFNSSIDAIALFDMAGHVIDANPACTKMLDLELERLLEQTSYDLTADHWHDFEQRIVSEEVVAQGFSHEYEKELVRRGGSLLPVSVRSWLVEDEVGEATGIWCLMRDLSERKEAEKQRRQLEAQMLQTQKLESLGVLAGGIAHDFNNLLMGILGNAGLARLDLPSDSAAQGRLRDIETAGQRAAELCRQMLAYSGKGHFVVEPVNLSQLSADMAHLLEVSISKKARLRFNFSPALPPIEVDQTQIRQVVMNLITNASDALGDGEGTITLTTGVMDCDADFLRNTYFAGSLKAGRFVFLEVADDGCGMDAETQARMFDPFFSTKFTGHGLGLAATLGIVRGHQGAVKVDSRPGVGTRFRVLFPCTETPRRTTAEETGRRTGPAEGGGKALVIDDEEMVLTVAERVLRRAGFEVMTAGDGQSGFELFREHAGEIDVVLLDMTMPRLSGEEALRRMRRLREDVRVILTSGYDEREATEKLSDRGFAGFLQKPYPPSALVEKVREVLGGDPEPEIAARSLASRVGS